MTLELGQLTETVTVESASSLLQTDKADVSTELKSKEIAALPLNQFRNYQALVNLVPGTVPMRFQNAETDTPARSLAANVNGQAINSNATRTDGATNVNIWLPSHNMYVSPAETVDTVNISTSNFDAEQGMAGGAAITVVTKSGTNQFRGSAFGFHNNDESERDAVLLRHGGGQAGQAAGQAQHLRRHAGRSDQEGQVVLLRVVRGLQERAEPVHASSTCRATPCAMATSAGAINANGTLQTIYNPSTGNPDGSGRTPFAEQPDPGGHDQCRSRSKINCDLFPRANTAGHRRRRPDQQLPARGDAHDRSP